MRHRQRLSYATSTVLGLTAPVLAAVLLTSSVPSTAEPVPPAPTMAADLDDPIPHAAAPAPAPAPTAAAVIARAAAVAAPRKVVSHRTVTVRATHRAAVRQTTRTTTTTTTTKTSTSSGWTTTAQPWGTDDYPYRTQSDFYAIDKWGFTERQCVSFAAWRLAQHGHAISNTRDNWGSAYTWDDTARRLGDRVTSTPRIGAIAQWNAHESGAYYGKGASKPNGTFTAGGYGHVGWVKAVYADGSALVEQYNLGGDRSYSVMRVKAPRYLLIG